MNVHQNTSLLDHPAAFMETGSYKGSNRTADNGMAGREVVKCALAKVGEGRRTKKKDGKRVSLNNLNRQTSPITNVLTDTSRTNLGRSSVNWQSSSSWPQNSKRFGANKYRLNRAQQNQQETDENSMREMASIASQNGLPFRSNKPQYKNHQWSTKRAHRGATNANPALRFYNQQNKKEDYSNKHYKDIHHVHKATHLDSSTTRLRTFDCRMINTALPSRSLNLVTRHGQPSLRNSIGTYVLEGSERFIYLRENLLFDSTMRARPPSREKFVFASDSGRVINDALTNKIPATRPPLFFRDLYTKKAYLRPEISPKHDDL
ncbi:Oidioi.mRNA.OKI2018_I69.chr2.g6221.t1.cds [Oikopleura dioica]|uniref:Oidioi.mRNA.OKI2018_I69.chr2.g6221.t1.cds n=1 Tax=Oikopleura dioica TaxID=34765 RepID=A0ABN7TBP8_OIKDI|nr:Oidioi.mRNA.OKI2018_I69.chr2.g6221.t1.cds [Oikopleura dioica]